MKLKYFTFTDRLTAIERQFEALENLYSLDCYHENKVEAAKVWNRICKERRFLTDNLIHAWYKRLPRFSNHKLAVIAKHKKRAEALHCFSEGKLGFKCNLIFHCN